MKFPTLCRLKLHGGLSSVNLMPVIYGYVQFFDDYSVTALKYKFITVSSGELVLALEYLEHSTRYMNEYNDRRDRRYVSVMTENGCIGSMYDDELEKVCRSNRV